MLKSWKSAVVLAIPVMAFMAMPAVARDGYYRDHRGGDDAAIAIGAGVVGLALGAAIASSNRDRDRGYYYDDSYYYPRGDYYRSYPRYYYNYDGPRYRRQWNGWRHDGRGNRGWDDDGSWGHGGRRWGY